MGAYLPTIGVPVLAPRRRGDAGPFFDFDRADNRNFKLKHNRPTASGYKYKFGGHRSEAEDLRLYVCIAEPLNSDDTACGAKIRP